MIDKVKYDRLKREFGKVASWAYWNDPAHGRSETQNCKEFIGPGCFGDEKKVLANLQNKYAFVGLNPSGEAPTKNQQESMPDWNNFHNTSNDARLRHVLKDTPYWGSYITDFFKGNNPDNFSSDSSSDKVNREENDPKVQAAWHDLETELDILGDVGILFALGHKAESYLKKFVEHRKRAGRFGVRVIYFPHYSMHCNADTYLAKVQEALGISPKQGGKP